MQQIDWVGEKPSKPFKDIRNTKDAVAEEKARLCLRLGELLKLVPPCIKSGGSVNKVREFKADHTAAQKVVGNKRASREELQYQIRAMERWHQ